MHKKTSKAEACHAKNRAERRLGSDPWILRSKVSSDWLLYIRDIEKLGTLGPIPRF